MTYRVKVEGFDVDKFFPSLVIEVLASAVAANFPLKLGDIDKEYRNK